MPRASHHVAVLTDDAAAVHTFLTEVVGLPEHLRFHVSGENLAQTAGWPPSDGADVVMYGTPPSGIVEVIEIPHELRAVVSPRMWLTSFAVGDVEARVASARRLGFAASDPVRVTGDVDLTASMIEVGGVTWELVRFEA